MRTWGFSDPSSGTEGVSSMGPRMRGAGRCARARVEQKSRAETDESRVSLWSMLRWNMVLRACD